MGKIDTIETISNKLAASTIDVEPKRCAYIRNWHSKCRACLSVCQHEAIKRRLGHLSIDSDTCTNCGACVCACPTSTFSTTAPSAKEIVRRAQLVAQRNAGSAAFICEKHAQALNIDTERVVVLPCLNYLDEYLITGMFALNFKRVVLFTCSCEGCDIDCEQPYFEEMVRSAQDLLDLWNVPGKLRTLDEVPPTLLLGKQSSKAKAIQSDRREALKQTGASVLGEAWQYLGSAIGSFTGEVKDAAEDRQIVVSPDERFDASTYRSVRLLKMLDHIGERPYGATLETRFWASVDIDPDLCKHCGACARMCPTQALKYRVDDENRATLIFQPHLCINCRLCKDTCLSHSMIYTNKVPASELDLDVIKVLFKNVELPQKPRPTIPH